MIDVIMNVYGIFLILLNYLILPLIAGMVLCFIMIFIGGVLITGTAHMTKLLSEYLEDIRNGLDK
jgi:hypothetical protein